MSLGLNTKATTNTAPVEVFEQKVPQRDYLGSDFALPALLGLGKIENPKRHDDRHEPAVVLPQTLIHRINSLGLVCVTYCVSGTQTF